jgi:hypothetical protein
VQHRIGWCGTDYWWREARVHWKCSRPGRDFDRCMQRVVTCGSQGASKPLCVLYLRARWAAVDGTVMAGRRYAVYIHDRVSEIEKLSFKRYSIFELCVAVIFGSCKG